MAAMIKLWGGLIGAPRAVDGGGKMSDARRRGFSLFGRRWIAAAAGFSIVLAVTVAAPPTLAGLTMPASPTPTSTSTAEAATDTPTDSATPLPGLCGATPRPGCRPSRTSTLLVSDEKVDIRDRVLFEYAGGDAAVEELGRPDRDTDYALCIYDATPAIVLSATVPAGATCRRRPCWRKVSRGFRYGDRRPYHADGAKKVLLKGGVDAVRTKLKFVLQGDRIGGSPSEMPMLPLADGATLVVQVVNGAGICWEGSFTGERIRVNAKRTSLKATQR